MTSQHAFLYIEDNAASRKVMHLLLVEMLGYVGLTMLSDSKDLSRRLNDLGQSFDVIFLDINITPMDGYDICRALRADPAYAKARIIAVTATATPSDLEHMQAVGFDGAISKPLNLEDFPTQLEMILSGENLWETL